MRRISGECIGLFFPNGSTNDNENTNTNSGGGNPFIGTWNGTQDGDSVRFVFSDSAYTVTWPDLPGYGSMSGTYNYTGSSRVTLYHSSGSVIGNATVSGNKITG